tara:strand:- start:1805 stop:2560 length:756 start_codon:yes stop_codon:yes gene_type:complete
LKTVEINCLGYAILADWYDGERTDEVLLYLMGSTSTRKRQQELVEAIVRDTGMSTLVIDYTGHGESPFELEDIRPAQHLLEVITAYDWIAQHYPNATISIVSGSYGAFLAAHLIAYRPVEKLVLRVPAIYKPEALYDVWGDRMEDEEKYRIMSEAYRRNIPSLKAHPIFEKNAKQFTGKTFVVVHSEDELIPSEVTDVYIEAFSADYYIADGFKHAVSQSNPTEAQMAAYQKAISGWLKKGSRSSPGGLYP